MPLLPISTVIPTLGRPERLRRTLASLLAQSVLPAEIIIIDASSQPATEVSLAELLVGLTPAPRIICRTPTERGAAVQRNQGFAIATQPYVLFSDDDVDLEPGCLAALWQTLQNDPRLGGCGVVITNQYYHPPGYPMRLLYRLLGCPATGSLAGRCCGPALNFLPALDQESMTAVQTVDWLNLCFTLYRRNALPRPPLLGFFHGYSLMEDAALALAVGREWGLAAPVSARLYHDSTPASYKDRPYVREKMEVINRWFVMRRVMNRDSLGWDLRQLGLQCFMLAISLRSLRGWRRFPAAAAGKVAGLTTVILHGHRWRGYSSFTKT
jgi:glycosyltransferase involved in cell wall biosynthesis